MSGDPSAYFSLHASSRSAPPAIVGRQSEIEELDRIATAVSEGESRIVVIAGEAGIGKSRLIEHVVDQWRRRPTVNVLRGTCLDAADSPLPFGPFVEAFRPLARRMEEGARRTLLAPVHEQLASLLPVLDVTASAPRKAPDLTNLASRPQLFEAVLTLIEGLGEHGTLVMVLEDLQWADASSLDLLSFLATNLVNARVVVLVSYRSDELSPGGDFLRYIAQLQRSRLVTRLTLTRLQRDALLEHIEELNGVPVEHDVAEMVWSRSQGNPLYAEELYRSLVDGDSSRLPSSIRDSLLNRLKAQSAATQDVIRAAAVGGMSIDSATLAAVLRSVGSDHDLDHALREAVDSGIIVRSGDDMGLMFRHALLREVAYGDLLPGSCRSLHGAYASVISQRPESTPYADLARHAHLGGDEVSALTASLHAAEQSASANAHAERRAHLQRALELWPLVADAQRPKGVTYAGVLMSLADASHLEGAAHAAVDHARAALLAAEDDNTRLHISVQLGCYLQSAGNSTEALATHERTVLNARQTADAAIRIDALCSCAHSLSAAASHARAAEMANEALTMARAHHDRAGEARALSLIGVSRVMLAKSDDGLQDLRESLAIAEALHQPIEIASGYCTLAATLSGPLNQLQEALEIAQTGLRHVRELGLERHWGVTLQSIIVDTLFRMGRWNEADDVVTAALRRSPRGVAAIDLMLAQIKLMVGRGHCDDAHHQLVAVQELSSQSLELRYKVQLQTLMAGLALWEGRIDDARRAAAADPINVHEPQELWLIGQLVWHGMRAEAEAAERDRSAGVSIDHALQEGERLRELSRACAIAGRQRGAVQRVVDAYDLLCEGEFRRIKGEPSEEIWAEVARLWEELGQTYPATYGKLHWGRAILQQSRRSQAATPILTEALLAAGALGAEPLRQQIIEVAARAGISLVRDEPVIVLPSQSSSAISSDHSGTTLTGAGLTKRESQVLELLATGASNREIADTCFISEKTASVHVSRVMAKLNVRSRTQAAAVFHEVTHASTAAVTNALSTSNRK